MKTCFDCGQEINRLGYRSAVYCLPCANKRVDIGLLASRKVKAQIDAGAMPHPSLCVCVDCGDKARDYDHRDYGKPLDVEPVCRRCNILRGPGKLPPELSSAAE